MKAAISTFFGLVFIMYAMPFVILTIALLLAVGLLAHYMEPKNEEWPHGY